MLDVGRLATLRAVLEHGSFSAAASALALTQPAVSRQIALLEREAGTQLVLRSRLGVRATEAGRLLAGHADVLLARIALAEEQLAEMTGLRRGRVRLGSFFTALVELSPQVCAWLDRRHPGIEVEDELVDRAAALAAVAGGDLDIAVVFEHDFEPAGSPPPGVVVHPLFDDPVRVLIPAAHRLAPQAELSVRDLADETWIRAHEGSAARLVEHVLGGAGVRPPTMLAGRGDEPVETQVLVAAGAGVTVAHELNVIVGRADIAIRPLRGPAPVRRVAAAVAEGQAAPAPLAVLDALRWCAQARSGRSG